MTLNWGFVWELVLCSSHGECVCVWIERFRRDERERENVSCSFVMLILNDSLIFKERNWKKRGESEKIEERKYNKNGGEWAEN